MEKLNAELIRKFVTNLPLGDHLSFQQGDCFFLKKVGGEVLCPFPDLFQALNDFVRSSGLAMDHRQWKQEGENSKQDFELHVYGSRFSMIPSSFVLLKIRENSSRLDSHKFESGNFLPTLEARLGFTSILNLSLNLLFLRIFVGLSVVSILIAAAATSPPRTPLAEFAVRAIMLLILALFQTADESVGRYLKTHSIFIDKCFFIIGHLLL